MACKDPVRKVLDRLLAEDAIVGYQIKDDEVLLFVEDEAKARAIAVERIQGKRVTIRATGRFIAL